jgi:hypothetical protein
MRAGIESAQPAKYRVLVSERSGLRNLGLVLVADVGLRA